MYKNSTTQKSRVGLSVNKLRQKYSGTETASVAKKLIKSWKKLLPGVCVCARVHVCAFYVPHLGFTAGQSSSRESTPKSSNHSNSKSGSNSPKSTPLPPSSLTATPITAPSGLGNPPEGSPPPVVYSKQGSNSSSHSSSEGGVAEKNGNGEVPLRRLSSTSDEIILNFPLTVDSYSRASSTGSDVRDRCRDLLAKALMKGFDKGATVSPFNLC